MNKQDQRDILAAYLEETLTSKGINLDEKALNLINENVQLKERPLPENEQRRLVKLSEDTSGKKKATSIKLTNLMELSVRDILSFIAKEVEILLFRDTEKEIVYALLVILFEFSSNLKFTFEEQEAEVLFAIARLRKKEFTTDEVDEAYQEAIQKSLPENRLEASLEKLVQLRVLRRTATKEYELKEKIKNLRR